MALGAAAGQRAKPSKARWVVGVIVLAAAGVLVVKGMVKSDKGATQAATAGFANPAATQVTAGADTKAEAAAADETTVGTTLGAFAELNTAAAKTDAVFVFLPGKEGTTAKAPSAPMKAAVRTMEAQRGEVRPVYAEAGHARLRPDCEADGGAGGAGAGEGTRNERGVRRGNGSEAATGICCRWKRGRVRARGQRRVLPEVTQGEEHHVK